MKRHLLASSMILAASLGAASAEVTLSGSARMGVIDDFGADNTGFTSRARVEFTLSGETDTGLSFGASFRADNAVGANEGTAGSVFLSGAFGKLSMGDVDGAANTAVGHVSGVGLTGLSDLNEISYISNGGSDFDDGGTVSLDDTVDPTALYEYSMGDFTFYASSTQPNQPAGGQAVAAAVKYSTGAYTFAVAYENLNAADDYVWEQVVVGATATFGAVTVKAAYVDGKVDTGGGSGPDWDQAAVSVDYTMDALTFTAFYTDDEDAPLGVDAEAYGLGAAYDLGGGAKVVGGYVKNESDDTSAADLGVSFAF